MMICRELKRRMGQVKNKITKNKITKNKIAKNKVTMPISIITLLVLMVSSLIGVAQAQSTTLSKAETNLKTPNTHPFGQKIEEDENIVKLRSYLKSGSDALNQRNYENAQKQFSYVITHQKTPENFRVAAMLGRAIAYQKMEINDKALSDYNTILKNEALTGKKRTIAYYNRGLIHRNNQNLHEAIKDFTHTLLIEEHMAMAYYARADSRVKINDLDRAVKDYELAIIYGYENPFLAHYGKALAFEKLDKKEEMIAALKQALELKPNHLDALNKYVQVTGKEFENAQISRRIKKKNSKITQNQSAKLNAKTIAYKSEGRVNKASVSKTNVKNIQQTREPINHINYGAQLSEKINERHILKHHTYKNTDKNLPQISNNKINAPWMIQLSAQAKKEHAHYSWKNAQKKYTPILDAFEPVFMPAHVNGNQVWRVRIAGFNSASEAKNLCANLKKQGGTCYAVRNN